MVGGAAPGAEPDQLRGRAARAALGGWRADRGRPSGRRRRAGAGRPGRGQSPTASPVVEAWGAHAEDLDVLALGPRSPADQLTVTWDLVRSLRSAISPQPGQPARPAGQAGQPARAAAGPRSLPMRQVPPEVRQAQARRTELIGLFALGRDFQLALSGTVAAAWSRRPRPRAGTWPRPGPRWPPRWPGGWPRPPPAGWASTLRQVRAESARRPRLGHGRAGRGRAVGHAPGALAGPRSGRPGCPVVDGHLVVEVLAAGRAAGAGARADPAGCAEPVVPEHPV